MPKQLLLFDDVNSWIELGDGVAIKIDYPNIEQHAEIQKIYNTIIMKRKQYFINKGVDFETLTNADIMNYSSETEDDINHAIDLEDLGRTAESLLVKYCLKDWTGFNNVNGEPIILKLKQSKGVNGTELSDLMFNSIIYNQQLFREIYIAIAKKLTFTEIDKKKYLSEDC